MQDSSNLYRKILFGNIFEVKKLYMKGVSMLNTNRFLSIFLTIVLVFSLLPNFAYASDSAATIEKLVKNVESQSKTLVNQMSSSNVKVIKVISSNSTTTLTSAINKAKASLKNFKGKQKSTFEKRIKVAEQTLLHVKTYNTAITNGTNLVNQTKIFTKAFESTPFESEKSYSDLARKNEEFTTYLSKLMNKVVRTAFSTKFQTDVKKELHTKKEFFQINERIDSFMEATKSLENVEVWKEYRLINELINKPSLDEELQDLLFEKWHNTYYPTLVSHEAPFIESLFKDYYAAMNARDPLAAAELFPYGNEEEKQELIEFYTFLISIIPPSYSAEVTKVEVEFVLNNDASALIELKETLNGRKDVQTFTGYFTKVNGKWTFGNESLESEFESELESE